MKGEMNEYMLYLPLYDGIETLEIGIEEKAVIRQPQVESPRNRTSCYLLWNKYHSRRLCNASGDGLYKYPFPYAKQGSCEFGF